MYPVQPPTYAPVAVRDDRMAIDDEHSRTIDHSLGLSNATTEVVPSTNNTTAQTEQTVSQPSKDKKGKKKATEDELQQQADKDRQYRLGIKQRIAEGEDIPPEVLAIARRIHEHD